MTTMNLPEALRIADDVFAGNGYRYSDKEVKRAYDRLDLAACRDRAGYAGQYRDGMTILGDEILNRR